jgi:hypothetical protein
VAASNPWAIEPQPAGRAAVTVLRSVPQADTPAPPPPRRDGLKLWRPATAARLYWVGASGGAGETTLAGVFPGSAATGHRWPTPPGPPAPAVLVARTTYASLVAAQTALTQYADGAAGNCRLLGLLLSADAPVRRPKTLQQLINRITGIPELGRNRERVWELPVLDSWRLPPTEPPAPHPTSLAAVLTAIAAALSRP